MNSHDEIQLRVLILALTAKDAETTCDILRSKNIATFKCQDLLHLCNEAGKGAGAAILPEEVLLSDHAGILNEFLVKQPAWSDFPLVILTRQGLAARGTFVLLSKYRNFTLLERPMQMAVLLATVGSVLRDRQRQYAVRDLFLSKEKSEESLRIADRRKDEFIAMLGHELRNPLAAIASGVQLLSRQSVSDEGKQFAIETVSNQVKLMSHIINDLLDVARISNGKIALKTAPIRLREVLYRVLAVTRQLNEKSNHHLEIEIEDDDLWVMADATRAEQIFTNLLSNALKYTNRGGHIKVHAQAVDKEAVITIQDSGVGISAELLPHIFELFTQAESTLARSKGGLGIGLTLVKKLVEMHGGQVIATSAGKDKGCTFTVKLPLIEPPREIKAKSIRPKQIHKSRRVLVVDDNQAAAKTLALFLTDCGCEVQTAFTGKAAIERAQEFRPEAALLDIGLPDLSGYEVAGRFLEKPELQNTLLIAVTGYTKQEDRNLSKQAGFKHHLAKPVDHEQLIALLN